MNSRLPIDRKASSIMLLLCLIWALQQMVLKAAAPDISPMLLIGLRSGVSAVLVAGLMLWRGEGLLGAPSTWRPGLLVGALFTLEFVFVAEGVRLTTASHAVVFLYTAPILVALALHWRLPAERLQPLQWAGIALAFAGVVVTFAWRGQTATTQAPDMLRGDVLVLLGAAGWAATTVVVRCSSLASAPATRTLLYQLVVAFVVLTPLAPLLGHGTLRSTALTWGVLVFQAVVVSFASYLTWFWLLRKYLASRLGVFSFMTPLFGIVLGVLVLHEPLEAGFVLGAALVLAGIALVNGAAWLRHGWQRLYRGETFNRPSVGNPGSPCPACLSPIHPGQLPSTAPQPPACPRCWRQRGCRR